MERMVLLRSLFRSAAFRSCRFSAVVNHHQQLRHYASSRSLFNLFAPTAIASRQALPSGTFFSKCSSLIAVDRKKKYSEKWTWIETFDFFFLFSFSFSVLIGVNLFALKSNFQMIQRLNPKINWALIGRFSCLNLPWIV